MSIPLSTPVDRVHFHSSISHCIFMCIVGSENMLLSERLEQAKFIVVIFLCLLPFAEISIRSFLGRLYKTSKPQCERNGCFFLLQLEQKKKRTCFRPDLNWRPSACEADVITTTLRKLPRRNEDYAIDLQCELNLPL